jgi:hypothetical protein
LNTQSRPDLPNHGLYILLALAAAALLLSLVLFSQQKPGSPIAQWSAAIGVCLLLAPLFFSLLKRSGYSDSPPFWFVTHVLGATLGACLILLHAAGGNWLSPPGLVLLLMLFLLIQGTVLRTTVSRSFAHLFAHSSIGLGFSAPTTLSKIELGKLIERKTALLQRLDCEASEALFSPTLGHWLGHPWLSFRYQSLIDREARMVGARQAAGKIRGWSRRIHMAAAVLFYAGLLTHIIVVLFFAGYAAGDGDIDWWYITAWGK